MANSAYLTLLVKNLWRWFRYRFVAWSLLVTLYSIALWFVLRSIAPALKMEWVSSNHVFFLTWILLGVPAFLEWISLPQLPFKRGFLSGKSLERLGGALGRLYLRHELRKGSTWLGVIGAAGAGTVFLVLESAAGCIFAAQLPLQRGLYSLWSWRKIAFQFHPRQGPRLLIGSFLLSQMIQTSLLIAYLGLVGGVAGVLDLQTYLRLSAGLMGGTWASASFCLEGDSGQPLLVNLICMTAALFFGVMSFAYPIVLLGVGYLSIRMIAISSQRFRSVENFDEDTLLY